MVNLEQRVEVLERQMLALRRQIQRNEEWLNTISSPPWKRLWWFLCGYRVWRVGRWYGKTEELR